MQGDSCYIDADVTLAFDLVGKINVLYETVHVLRTCTVSCRTYNQNCN